MPAPRMVAQTRKQVVDLSGEGIFQIVDTADLRARPINAPILIVVSSRNQVVDACEKWILIDLLHSLDFGEN